MPGASVYLLKAAPLTVYGAEHDEYDPKMLGLKMGKKPHSIPMLGKRVQVTEEADH